MNKECMDLEKGVMVVVMSNGDGTFSPLAMTQSQSLLLESCLASLSQTSQFYLNKEVKLVVE